jgi:hypothetical protein
MISNRLLITNRGMSPGFGYCKTGQLPAMQAEEVKKVNLSYYQFHRKLPKLSVSKFMFPLSTRFGGSHHH